MKKVLFPILAVVLALSLALPMAAVVGAQPTTDTIYGITNTGSIHQVDPISGSGTEIDTVVNCPTGGSGPNGLAYDQDTNRIYYLEYPDQAYDGYSKDGKASLYFTDLDTGVESFAGLLEGEIADADIYEGHYYYIAGGTATGFTDDLYKVELLADGTVGTRTKYPDISAPDNHAYGFWGDIAIQDGVIYGIGDCKVSGHGYEFFTVNCDGTDFDYIADVTVGQGLQLAFGLDGTLYGHDFLNGNFYTITWTDTSVTVTSLSTSEFNYTDLASGKTSFKKCGDLIAGQHTDVGDVNVWNDGTNLYVTYEITETDWVIAETHLYVGQNLAPTAAPGQFPYNDDDATVTDIMVAYVIPLADIDGYHMQLNKQGAPTGVMVADGVPGVEPCEDIYIAAHAEVQKITLITAAPYYASTVVDVSQGLRKDGTPVLPARSTPEQGLAFETGQNESNFFSLGFGGWIIVEFDCPIRNGEGDDVQVIEDTWGSYPVEKADVYASQDGITWTYLGEADNTNRYLGIHTITDLDLGNLDWAKYIKVVDTTDPAVHNAAADGYDLNAVASLQDCIEIQEETAWGWCEENGGELPGANWATYLTYHVQ